MLILLIEHWAWTFTPFDCCDEILTVLLSHSGWFSSSFRGMRFLCLSPNYTLHDTLCCLRLSYLPSFLCFQPHYSTFPSFLFSLYFLFPTFCLLSMYLSLSQSNVLYLYLFLLSPSICLLLHVSRTTIFGMFFFVGQGSASVRPIYLKVKNHSFGFHFGLKKSQVRYEKYTEINLVSIFEGLKT